MSKWCRYVKTLQVYFVKMVRVWNKIRLHHHSIIIYYHTSNASLIIERSKHLSKQSEDWFMTTSTLRHTKDVA